MDKEEWADWEVDAANALKPLYCENDITIILDWFRSIKGSRERELIGEIEAAAMLVFVCAQDNLNIYNSLMARLFIYAPLILKEKHNDK